MAVKRNVSAKKVNGKDWLLGHKNVSQCGKTKLMGQLGRYIKHEIIVISIGKRLFSDNKKQSPT
jgi:hypothetical protein